MSSGALLEEAVSKSLKNKETPPKRKHERNIILHSWGERGAATIFSDIFKRPLNVREISCYKCLVVIHKLLREGHPKCLFDANARRNFFTSLVSYYKSSPLVYGKLSADYATYILAKIDFHVNHQDIEGTIALDKWLEAQKGGFDVGSAFTLVTHLLDLQQACLDFQAILLAEKELSDCKVSPLIPLVIESYNIYAMVVHLMKQLVKQSNNMDVFSFLQQRFYTQYTDLRKFYFTASNIRYLTSIIAVPVLGPDPPKFESNVPVKAKKSPRKPEPEPEPVIEVEVPDFNPRGPVMQNDLMNLFGNVAQPVQPPVNPNPNPFFNEWMSAPVQPQPVPQPVPAPEPQVIIKKEVPEDILRRIAELEKRVRELEAFNRQLQIEKNALMNENGALKKQLAEQNAKIAQQEELKKKILEEQIELANAALQASLYKFGDPNNLGNQSADTAGLMDAVERLKKMFGHLVSSVKENGKTPQASRDVSDAMLAVLMDTKGIAQFLEDYNLKNELLSSTRNAADSIAAFLEAIKSLVGTIPSSSQMGQINSEDAKIKALIAKMIESIDKTMKHQSSVSEQPGVDLEDVAERELLAAAKMIEDAAKQLEAHRAKRQSIPNPTGELNVEESILAAAMAITAATQGLVKAATDAQHERVVKGKASDPSAAKYHNDPMWVEGLISAARAVAEATRQLVGVANDAFQGRIDDAALIAASKAVGSSTAQLVAATRAKSTDPFSKTQTNLDNAAAAVTRATQALVRAAKKNEDAEFEAQMSKRNENIAQGIKAEIEQQAKILRLEKELEQARRALHGMNKSKYADASTPVQASPRVNIADDAGPFGASSSQQQATEAFNYAVKDLSNKVGANLSMRLPEPNVFDSPASSSLPNSNSSAPSSSSSTNNPFLFQ